MPCLYQYNTPQTPKIRPLMVHVALYKSLLSAPSSWQLLKVLPSVGELANIDAAFDFLT